MFHRRATFRRFVARNEHCRWEETTSFFILVDNLLNLLCVPLEFLQIRLEREQMPLLIFAFVLPRHSVEWLRKPMSFVRSSEEIKIGLNIDICILVVVSWIFFVSSTENARWKWNQLKNKQKNTHTRILTIIIRERKRYDIHLMLVYVSAQWNRSFLYLTHIHKKIKILLYFIRRPKSLWNGLELCLLFLSLSLFFQ